MSIGFALLGIASLVSGYTSYKSSQTQSQFQKLQGEATQFDYEHKSYLLLDEGYRLRQQQAMEYIGGGVELQGTPLLMLAETARRTEIEAKATRLTGSNINIISQQNARTTRGEGRSALISSIFTAGGYYLAGRK